MAVWSVKGGVLKEAPPRTNEACEAAVELVKRGRGRPPKAKLDGDPVDASPVEEETSHGDEI